MFVWTCGFKNEWHSSGRESGQVLEMAMLTPNPLEQNVGSVPVSR